MFLKKLGFVAWSLYLATVFDIVFVAGERRQTISPWERINLVPGKNLVQFYQTNPHSGNFYLVFTLQIVGNLLLMLPFGFLMKRSYPAMTVRRVVGYGFLLSAGIELTQLVLQIGVCDVGDVILNVAGVWMGALLFTQLKMFRNVKPSGHET